MYPWGNLVSVPQARQVLEREFSNLLALGTDRRLDEVSGVVVEYSSKLILKMKLLKINKWYFFKYCTQNNGDQV